MGMLDLVKSCDWASAVWLQQHSESAFFWDTLYKGVSAKDDFEIQTRPDFYVEAFTFQRLLAYYLAFSASSYWGKQGSKYDFFLHFFSNL